MVHPSTSVRQLGAMLSQATAARIDAALAEVEDIVQT